MGVDHNERIRPERVIELERRINAIEAKTWARGGLATGIIDVAVDDDNNIHIHLGPSEDAIAVYDTDGNPLYQYAVSDFHRLIGWGGSGHIYVWQHGTTSIKRYTKAGVLVDSPTLGSVYDIVVPGTSLDGYIYAVDATDGGFSVDFDIYQLNATGTSAVNSNSFSEGGDGDFDNALGLGINASNGNVYLWGQHDELESKVWRFAQNLSGRTEMVDAGDPGDTPGWSASAATTDEFALYQSNPGEINTYSSGGSANATISGNGLGGVPGIIATDNSNFLWWLHGQTGPDTATAHTKDYDGNNADSFIVNLLDQPISQTEWFRYPTTAIGEKVSLGTPDGGVSVPALDAIEFDIIRPDYTEDMHVAIEAMLVHWKNAVTGNAFDFDNLSSDNLYHVAVEPGAYNWRIPGLVTDQGARITEEWIDEIDSSLTKLEESELV